MPARSPAETVLVTGAAGAIGTATVARLGEQGYRVVGLDREPPTDDRIEWIRHDLLELDGTERILAGSPLLAGLQHMVAIAGGPIEDELGLLDPAEVTIGRAHV